MINWLNTKKNHGPYSCTQEMKEPIWYNCWYTKFFKMAAENLENYSRFIICGPKLTKIQDQRYILICSLGAGPKEIRMDLS